MKMKQKIITIKYANEDFDKCLLERRNGTQAHTYI